MTEASCDSFESSSNVFCFVSGKRNHVDAIPVSINAANIKNLSPSNKLWAKRSTSKGQRTTHVAVIPCGKVFISLGTFRSFDCLWICPADITTWPTMAPTFPMPADRPWHVDLYLVGKASPGMTNVVTFAPKLVKKLMTQMRKTKPGLWLLGSRW